MCLSAGTPGVEKIQERSLRLVQNDFTGEYGVLMEKSSKSTLYLGRLRRLHVCVGIKKAKNGLDFCVVHIPKENNIHSYALLGTNTLSLYILSIP